MTRGIKDFLGRMRRPDANDSFVRRIIGKETAVSEEMIEAQRLWKSMYESPGGLHLANSIAFEMARMITLEMRSNIVGSPRAELLNKSYQRVIDDIRIPVEYGCAKGGLIFKPYVAAGEIKVDFIQADEFFPTAFDEQGKIVGAVFVQYMVRDGVYYTRFESHCLKDGVYEISNRAFESRTQGVVGKEVPLSHIEEWKGLAEKLCIANVKKPLFGYFRPAMANPIDSSSPVGVSVFANAVNLIFDADKQYDRLLWEFESGERAVVANSMAFKRGKDGKLKLPDRRLYRTLDVEDVDFFKEWSPELREQGILNGLDGIFRQIEFNCGFAYGTLSALNDSDKTAEEIRASRQRSYTTVADNQKALKNALGDLVYAMGVWCSLYKLAPEGECRVEFDFDDSIAADRKTEFEEKQILIENGIMMPWEFRMWYFGEDEKTAKEMVKTKDA